MSGERFKRKTSKANVCALNRTVLMRATAYAAHLQAWSKFQRANLFIPLELGPLKPVQLAAAVERERMAFLMADARADTLWDAMVEKLVHQHGALHPEVWRLLDATRNALHIASAHSDNCRYLQAAELAYLRPLRWSAQKWESQEIPACPRFTDGLVGADDESASSLD
jgi:hypothetical protein